MDGDDSLVVEQGCFDVKIKHKIRVVTCMIGLGHVLTIWRWALRDGLSAIGKF